MTKIYRFNFKLKDVLEKRGITQKELAEITGIREATISEMSNDSRTVYNKKHLIKIMETLNITDIKDLIDIDVIEK